jgi:tol-pal system protein YbgF
MALATVCPAQGLAPVQGTTASEARLETRVERLERLLSGRGLMEVLAKLEQLQREVQELRGELEVQNHAMDGIRKRQRDLYLDLDRRLGGMQQGEDAAVAAPAPAAEPPRSEAPTTPAATPDRRYDPARAQADYQRARGLLNEARYAQSIKAFRGFLDEYPDNALAANAQYWLGEAYYVTREFDRALVEFGKVRTVDPESPKLADALLKIGYIHYEKQEWQSARDTLSGLTRSHPNSTAARLALQRLDRMKREGH